MSDRLSRDGMDGAGGRRCDDISHIIGPEGVRRPGRRGARRAPRIEKTHPTRSDPPLMSETTAAPTGARVPEKPALEGLEAKWSPRWETEGTYRFDRHGAA